MTPLADNVIPIDADAARQLAQHTKRFRMFVATLAAVWIAALAAVLVLSPLPPLAPFIVLVVLAVLAEHRFVLFDDETSMSASIVVVVTSVFVFSDTAPFAGPMLVASLGGLYLPLLRRREYAKAVTNCGGMGLAALISGSATFGIGEFALDQGAHLLAVAVTCVASYWVANNLIVACYVHARARAPLSASARELCTSDTLILWPALIAAISALSYRPAWLTFIACASLVTLHETEHAREQRSSKGLLSNQLLVLMSFFAVIHYLSPRNPLVIYAAIGLIANAGRLCAKTRTDRLGYSTGAVVLLLVSPLWGITLGVVLVLLTATRRLPLSGTSLLMGGALGAVLVHMVPIPNSGAALVAVGVGTTLALWVIPIIPTAMLLIPHDWPALTTAIGVVFPCRREALVLSAAFILALLATWHFLAATYLSALTLVCLSECRVGVRIARRRGNEARPPQELGARTR
jgi:hypothetical protein